MIEQKIKERYIELKSELKDISWDVGYITKSILQMGIDVIRAIEIEQGLSDEIKRRLDDHKREKGRAYIDSYEIDDLVEKIV